MPRKAALVLVVRMVTFHFAKQPTVWIIGRQDVLDEGRHDYMEEFGGCVWILATFFMRQNAS